MANDNTDLFIQQTSTFDEWRQKFNELATRSSDVNTVGELHALDEGIPGINRDSVIAAINFVYQQRIAEGQPLEDSSLTNCFVPEGTSLFVGGSDDFELTGTQNTLTLKNGASNVFHYDLTSGNFGIGTTSPASKLDVNGTGTFQTVDVKNPSNSLGMTLKSVPVGSRHLTIIETDSPLHINRDGQPLVLCSGGGKVGIGYDDESNLTETFSVYTPTTTTSSTIQTLNTKVSTVVDLSGIHYIQDSLEFMTVSNSGFVGIGKTTPSYALDVSGTAYADKMTFGSSLQAGSTTLVTVTVEGHTNVSLAAGSQLTHGGNVLINSSGKVTSLALSNITTDDISDSGLNKYLTIANLNTVLGANEVNSIGISSTGTLVHGTTTIVGTDSKIPGSVLTADTDDISEGTNLYFTEDRARSAVGNGSVTSVTVSSLVNLPKHDTGSRPTATEGAMVYDSTLKLPIFYDGTEWKDFAGNVV